jgi:predicted RNase H-like HicB family nuclease
MRYQVFVESQSEHQFVASVVGVPNCVAEGTSKEEAITKAKTALTEKMARGELVTIEIESQPINRESDPWLKHFGIFAKEPTFENFLEEVSAYRQAVDEETET